jgi:arylsulfatase A-like enzyme
MKTLSRRDFLKLMSVLPASLALSRLSREQFTRQTVRPNVILLVLDAMSAYHLSLYGYGRKTTPNFERFAERTNVYHAHYSTANFTIPGTASLLMGLYPWTHRGLHLSGLVKRDMAHMNLFALMGKDYHRFAFSQNVWATNLLLQFESDIDQLLPSSAFSDYAFLVSEVFRRDEGNAHQVLDHVLFDYVDAPGLLVFGLAQRLYFERVRKTVDRQYPRGVPQPRNHPISFKLANVFNGLMKTLTGLPRPFLAYIHLFPPHSPYRAHKDFVGIFDGTPPHIQKPEHVFSEGETYETIEKNRIWYDEYIANVDFEFGRLLDYLEQNGLLDSSYVIVTSDHGELLERGIKGHVTPVLYEPLVRVPLLISVPGQEKRQDFFSPTSSVDLVPSLLHVSGNDVPDWVEGRLLPGLGGQEDHERHVWMLEAKSSSAFGKLRQATFAMRHGRYKAILYRGYDRIGKDLIEIYDLESDPQEMHDLGREPSPLVTDLTNRLLEQFERINTLP